MDAPQDPKPKEDLYDIGAPAPEASATAAREAPAELKQPEPPPTVAVNAAGKPYDPSTGRLLPADTPIPVEPSDAPSSLAPGPGNQHPAHLVRRAQLAGLTEEDISEASTAELRGYVLNLEQRSRDAGQQRSIQDEQRPEPFQQAPVEAEWDPYRPEAGEETVKPDDLHPMIRRMADQLKKQEARLRQLEGVAGNLAQSEMRRQNETNDQTIDRVFVERSNLFGTQKIKGMKTDSAEYKRRMAVIDLVKRDRSRDDLEAKVRRGIETIYGEKVTAPAETSARVTPEDWDEGAVSQPTQRRSPALPSGVAKAEASVKAILDSQRSPVREDKASLDDFL